MVDCLNEGCRQVLPSSTLINTTIRQLTRAVSNDCNRNIVYITDNAGLVNTDTDGIPAYSAATTYAKGATIVDAGIVYQSLIDGNVGNTPASSPTQWKGTYLTKKNRFQIVSSTTQISQHWKSCDAGKKQSAYYDLNEFVSLGTGTGVSPGYAIVTYWDRAGGETLAQALDDLYKCFQCFTWIVHPTYLSDGTAFYDTTMHKDIEAWAKANDDKFVSNLTLDAVLKTTFTETSSQAAKAKALSYDNSHYTYSGEKCEKAVDASCNKTTTDEVRLSASHFKYAAIAASYASTDALYIPDPFFRGPTGIAGEPVADLTQTETINVTGTDRNQGGQLNSATRYVNAYHSVNGRKGFLYGTTVTGYFTYERLQAAYMKREMENAALDFLYRAQNRGISEAGLSSLETSWFSLITKYEGQGIITRDKQDFASRIPTGYSVVGQGDGWILAREDVSRLTLSELSQGYSPGYFFCFVSLRQLRFIDLTLCALLKPTQLSEVVV